MHLLTAVLPEQGPVRQRVLSLPHRLRFLMAYRREVCDAVLSAAVKTVLKSLQQRAFAMGLVERQ